MNGQTVHYSGFSRRQTKKISVSDQIEQIRCSYLWTSTITSVRGQIDQVKCSYFGVTAPKPVVPVKEGPVIPGSDLTQEQIAVALAGDMFNNKPLPSLQKERYGNLLYSSIKRLVYQNAFRYTTTCPDTVEDLSQDCFHKMMKKLNNFDPTKARFTTWVWAVCRSVLSNKYRHGLKGKDVICYVGNWTDENGNEVDMIENHSGSLDKITGQHNECPGVMSGEIVSALRKLVKINPSHEKLVHAIFGDFDGKEFFMPASVEIAEAAKSLGMEYRAANAIYTEEIRPFLRKALEGCYTP